ncbi:MAG TPA: acetyl-CoA C-acyltransferase [Gammaproteobacteria bacterium]|nr:acetyl-CoA C-acyltransferase [Gammaproteobacteria bacterium]
MKHDVVIVSAKRTPLGAFQGVFSTISATDLGAVAIKSLVAEARIEVSAIDEVFMGCVLPAGLGQAPARQAALKSGLAVSTACTTINKVCGSGMKSIMLAYDVLKAGSAKLVIAGGMESMSNAPYLLPKVRAGLRLGHHSLVDHLFFDGLENAEDNALMGTFAERCAEKYEFSREQQDAFAIESVTRALNALAQKRFESEIVPVTLQTRTGEQQISEDEQPFKCKIEKIPKLKPVFKPDEGTVTAANSSSLSDGAAALLLTTEAQASQQACKPIARIVAHVTHAQKPEDFTTAPVAAIQKVLQQASWSVDEVDLFEVNEAFAVVTMVAIKELKLDSRKVNIHGGACALGHPIGASGARIVVTLIHALQASGLQKGIASLCIGGGEATALAIEIM